MSDGRKKLSGAAYKALAKEKARRHDDVIAKAGKLHDYFNRERPKEVSQMTENPTAQCCEQVKDAPECIEFGNGDAVNVNTSCIDPDKPEPALPPFPFPKDPADWVIDDLTRDYVVSHSIAQNKDADFTKSSRQYGETCRFMKHNFFAQTLHNGERKNRAWLVYSEKKTALFCAPCRLFGGITQFATDGFNDWKNATAHLKDHENSDGHKSCVIALRDRRNIHGRIDKTLTTQLNEEVAYWRSILKRVVAVIRALSSRGLAVRGTEERFGSSSNGNYLMFLEIIAEFDPFLADHIARYSNKGSGTTSYLSTTICNEFIELMAAKLVRIIMNEIKLSKYFSISVDSTPDVSHVDQLSLIFRYVMENGRPVERFFTFIANPGHKSELLVNAVTEVLHLHDLDISNCRGQSYDNASNMSGCYSGLQARIKQLNPLATYIPCSAHSLNLIGTCAAECCQEAVSFFGTVQQLYNFFSASTNRWEILKSHLKKGTSVVKSLSITRWSARDEALQSLEKSWNEIIQALETIETDRSQKPVTRSEAVGIRKNLQNLESAIFTIFWGFLLRQFNLTSKRLQSVDIDIGTVVELYRGLLKIVEQTRNNFEHYEGQAKLLTSLDQYKLVRQRKKKLPYDVPRHGDTEMCPRDLFRTNTFLYITDKLSTELRRRSQAYEDFHTNFAFLENLPHLSCKEIEEHAANLSTIYPQDLERGALIDECLHLRAHLMTTNNTGKPMLRLCKFLRDEKLHYIYPHIDIAVRMFVCTPATNCTTERSFSCLKRVKNCLRSTLSHERRNALTLLTIESELLKSVSYDDLIDDFAHQKARRKPLS